MSKEDETHREPAETLDDASHGHDDHASVVDFVDESSGFDKLLQVVTVISGAGLIMMMWLFVSCPIFVPEDRSGQHLPPVHSSEH